MPMLDPLIMPTVDPLQAALASAQAATAQLKDDILAQVGALASYSGQVGWNRIAAVIPGVVVGDGHTEAERAAAIAGIVGMVGQLGPVVWPGISVPALDPSGPLDEPDAALVADAARSARDAGRALMLAISAARQTWSDLSAVHGWTALSGAGDLSKEATINAVIDANWSVMSPLSVPVIHTEPVVVE